MLKLQFELLMLYLLSITLLFLWLQRYQWLLAHRVSYPNHLDSTQKIWALIKFPSANCKRPHSLAPHIYYANTTPQNLGNVPNYQLVLSKKMITSSSTSQLVNSQAQESFTHSTSFYLALASVTVLHPFYPSLKSFSKALLFVSSFRWIGETELSYIKEPEQQISGLPFPVTLCTNWTGEEKRERNTKFLNPAHHGENTNIPFCSLLVALEVIIPHSLSTELNHSNNIAIIKGY